MKRTRFARRGGLAEHPEHALARRRLDLQDALRHADAREQLLGQEGLDEDGVRPGVEPVGDPPPVRRVGHEHDVHVAAIRPALERSPDVHTA